MTNIALLSIPYYFTVPQSKLWIRNSMKALNIWFYLYSYLKFSMYSVQQPSSNGRFRNFSIQNSEQWNSMDLKCMPKWLWPKCHRWGLGIAVNKILEQYPSTRWVWRKSINAHLRKLLAKILKLVCSATFISQGHWSEWCHVHVLNKTLG